MHAVDYYLSLSYVELAEVDLGELNLVCASNLPGAEDLDIDECSRWIDRIVCKVRRMIDANVDQFAECPSKYQNSMAVFYMTILCEVMTREPRVRYNPSRKSDPENKSNSQDLFVHGIINGDGGTCASLPVLYATVGRRLGFPLKLVLGTRHLFLRWVDDGNSPLANDRFNIEATAPGLQIYPDEHYLRWPFRVPSDFDGEVNLKSLSPREELAMFLADRSWCLIANGKYVQAIQPMCWAHQLEPKIDMYRCWQEAAILFALGVFRGCAPPTTTEEYVISDDGISHKKMWWPKPVDNAEYLPAAKLPPQLLNRILPKAGLDIPIGGMAEKLEAQLGQYADEQFVNHLLATEKAKQLIAITPGLNAINKANRERRMQMMPQSQRPGFPVGVPQPGLPQFPHHVQQPDRPAIPPIEQRTPPGFPHRQIPSSQPVTPQVPMPPEVFDAQEIGLKNPPRLLERPIYESA